MLKHSVRLCKMKPQCLTLKPVREPCRFSPVSICYTLLQKKATPILNFPCTTYNQVLQNDIILYFTTVDTTDHFLWTWWSLWVVSCGLWFFAITLRHKIKCGYFYSSKEKKLQAETEILLNADVTSLEWSERFNVIQHSRDQIGRSKLANRYFYCFNNSNKTVLKSFRWVF